MFFQNKTSISPENLRFLIVVWLSRNQRGRLTAPTENRFHGAIFKQKLVPLERHSEICALILPP